MTEPETDLEPAVVEYVTERHTTGGEGPEGQPDTVDESASLLGRAVEPHELAEADVDASEDDPDGPGGVPAKSANKPEWVAYAVSQGEAEADAEAMTKDALIEKYGQ